MPKQPGSPHQPSLQQHSHLPPSLPSSPLPKRRKIMPQSSPSSPSKPPANPTTHSPAPPPLSQSPPLLIQKLSSAAKTPTRGSKFAAGYDLYSARATTIPARGKSLVDTDLAIAVPEGTCQFSFFFQLNGICRFLGMGGAMKRSMDRPLVSANSLILRRTICFMFHQRRKTPSEISTNSSFFPP